ncbi:MAG: AraC family transcriptional regulator, partial [Chitinophagaceae bacterium]
MKHHLQPSFKDEYYSKRFEVNTSSGTYRVFQMTQKEFAVTSCDYQVMQNEAIQFSFEVPTIFVCMEEGILIDAGHHGSLPLKKEEVALIKVPSEPCSILLRKFKRLQFLAISFEIDLMKYKFQYPAIVERWKAMLDKDPVFIRPAKTALPEMAELITPIFQAPVGSQENGSLHLKIYALLKAVLQQYEVEERKQIDKMKIEEAKAFIELHFTEYDRPELLEKAGANTDDLISDFKEVVGLTPLKYYYRLQLEKAKELVIHTSMTDEQIIAQLKFPSVNMFSVRFKSAYGKSPVAYRKYSGRRPRKQVSGNLSR